MEYDNYKGKLLQEEKRRMWKVVKWVCIVSWVFSTVATLIGMLRGKDNTYILFMAMLLFLSLLILFLLFGPQWGPMRLYENGFIPDMVPLKYANKRNDYFVRWKDVTGIEFPPPISKALWVATIQFKKGKKVGRIIISASCFKDSDKVINKLRDVERRLKEEGELAKSK